MRVSPQTARCGILATSRPSCAVTLARGAPTPPPRAHHQPRGFFISTGCRSHLSRPHQRNMHTRQFTLTRRPFTCALAPRVGRASPAHVSRRPWGRYITATRIRTRCQPGGICQGCCSLRAFATARELLSTHARVSAPLAGRLEARHVHGPPCSPTGYRDMSG